MKKFVLTLLSLVFSLLVFLVVNGNTANISPRLLKLDLEDLLNIEVTSVSKYKQKVEDIPAAIYVITAEDIKHSYANLLPELFRDVPGVYVARITSSDWAISIRGFNDRFANKLLILMDGRTLYTPIFSGVFWERQDTVLDDIERIEVIRGPGGSIWGANAVNGVINIVTKSAWDTQGLLLKTSIGSDATIITARYGAHTQNLAYRIYTKAKEVSSLLNNKGEKVGDDWRTIQGGFRIDYKISDTKSLRISSDISSGIYSALHTLYIPEPPYEIFLTEDLYGFQGNIFLKLENRKKETDEGWYLQSYYDASSLWHSFLLDWNTDIFDIEFRHHFHRRNSHWTWGIGYRKYIVSTEGSEAYYFRPDKIEQDIVNLFVQNELHLKDHWNLITGSKYETYGNGADAIQPSIKLLYKISHNQSCWISISHAVRTPSMAEKYMIGNIFERQESGIPFYIELRGNDNLKPEKLTAFELGYRGIIKKNLFVDLATYYYIYDDLITIPTPKDFPEYQKDPWPHFIAKTFAQNIMNGKSYGFEISIQKNLTNNLNLKANYSYNHLSLSAPQDTIFMGEYLEKAWPRHMLNIISNWKINDKLTIGTRLRYISDIPIYKINDYIAIDTRLTWKPSPRISISIVGTNINDPRHPEYRQNVAIRTPPREIGRSIFLSIKFLGL